jgi:tRNA (mo5U34)-methyltransferase
LQAQNKWELLRLPEDMTGKSFLDVGCWEGHRCVDALLRGAAHVVGVDLCTSQALRDNLREYNFEFVQTDIFSEKFLQLDRYDVVLCSGVLYHVESPISLLVRLRKCVKELLVLETASHRLDETRPILLFHAASDLANNPSNWWTPNELCLRQMLEATGFQSIEIVWARQAASGKQRICVHARPGGRVQYDKILPRKRELMSVYGGDRPQGDKLLPKGPSKSHA